jgi:hypothetical protein
MQPTPMAFFEGKYTIHADGTIISHRVNEVIKPSKNPNGYYKYTFTLNGVKRQRSIHRVVAEHFLPNPYNHPQVNHKDGDKSHNAVSNLEWCTREENIQHSLRAGLRKGYMSANDKELYLQDVLSGKQVKVIAEEIKRRPETLHKMLRETAERLCILPQWQAVMKENRKNAAIRNLKKINN